MPGLGPHIVAYRGPNLCIKQSTLTKNINATCNMFHELK